MTLINDVTDYTVENGVALVTLDFPPVNALGHAVRLGISAGLDRAFADPGVVAVVLICGGRTFFAGADITEFGKPLASPVLREIAVQIEAADKPVVAAIHGMALGGGLEVALSCHWRIAERSARLGLPEVKLGLLAGAGGTQRLPRLVGAEHALHMVVTGDPIGADEALQQGLVDRLAEDGGLRAEAVAFARDVAATPQALRRVRDLPAATASPALFAEFRRTWAGRLRGFDAPEASIRCIEAATSQSFEEGMKTERALFEDLMVGVQCMAQRYVFFAEREAAKVPGLPREIKPRRLGTALVIGAAPQDGIIDRLRAAGLAVRTADSLPDPGKEDSDLVLDLLPGGVSAQDAARAAEGAIVLTCGPADPQGRAIRVDFGRLNGTLALFELLRGKDMPDEVLATLLALAKRLGLASVVTHAGEDLIGPVMEKTLAAELARCLSGGVGRDNLADALSGFGIAAPLPQASETTGVPPVPAAGSLDGILAACINRAAGLLDQGAAIRAADIDIACVKRGLWKAYRGGPMFHADQMGLEQVLAALDTHARRFGGDTTPSPLLHRLVRSGQPLHQYKGTANV